MTDQIPKTTQTNNQLVDPKTKQAHTWGMLCHLSALSQVVGVPLGHLLGPLVVWLIKKDVYPYVDTQGRESLNFQISMSIYMLVAGALSFAFIGIPILIGLVLTDLIFVIVASVKASSGQIYRYPLTIRFLP